MKTMNYQISSVARVASLAGRRVNSKSLSVTMAMGTLLLYGMLVRGQANPGATIGAIDFFGYKGLDVAKVRAAMPVREGDQLGKQTKGLIEEAIAKVIGKKPTEVATVCCDQKGRSLIYIGLPGATYKPFHLNPAPTGSERLPEEILKLEDRAGEALAAAVKKGGGASEEDDSLGYALIKDPTARALQREIRTWALRHAQELMSVLQSSSEAKQRRVASVVLGYAQQSREQMVTLVRAARDPDAFVRNNATRALGVLVRSNAKLAEAIEPETFLAMLGSGTWSDHNKAVALLNSMSRSRDPKLLAKIREQALEPLIEMALWREAGHAYDARMVLGRLAGIPEEKLTLMAWTGPVDEIIAAARRKE
jgi:hypothetical protein